jgi:hypothetical protein
MQAGSFGTSCYIKGDEFEDTRRVLAYFQFLPAWIVVFHATLGVYLSDFFFIVSNTLTQLIIYYYTLGMAEAIRSERPAPYDYALCNSTRYAVPDPLFIATMSYCFVVGYGLFSRRSIGRRIGVLYRVLFGAFPILYIVGEMVNAYFFWWQLLINLGVAFLLSYLYVFIYWRIVNTFALSPALRWLSRLTGIDNVVLSTHPYFASRPRSSQRRAATATAMLQDL